MTWRSACTAEAAEADGVWLWGFSKAAKAAFLTVGAASLSGFVDSAGSGNVVVCQRLGSRCGLRPLQLHTWCENLGGSRPYRIGF